MRKVVKSIASRYIRFRDWRVCVFDRRVGFVADLE